MNIDEIKMTDLPRATTYKYFNAIGWKNYVLLPVQFRNFDVVFRDFGKWKIFTIIDPKNAKKSKNSLISGINYEITNKNVVGGVEMARLRAPKGLGTAWEAVYLALNPSYQGQGIAKDFYLWLLQNAKHTKIGMIKAGDSQTIGSRKLWQELCKRTLMFAYSPATKQISVVELNEDGELEADFSIYPGSYSDAKQIEQDIMSIQDKLSSKADLSRRERLDLEQQLAGAYAAEEDLESATSTELYMTMSLK